MLHRSIAWGDIVGRCHGGGAVIGITINHKQGLKNKKLRMCSYHSDEIVLGVN